jgi:2-amino-4-hydroxy-6-hydroxymethyldihydropteridine diphosphokinase / dihydropteroate synthase
MICCAIALGSNMGNRPQFLASARQMIANNSAVSLRATSPIYETPALLPENAPASWDIPYLNQVIEIATILSPHALLALLKQVEVHLGRVDRGRWSPREIDCDILFYGTEQIADAQLTIPHPRMCERRFVLQPLIDISPEIEIHSRAACEWLAELPPDEGMRRYRSPVSTLVGVVNITPDSFSDGGKYLQVDAALSQIEKLIADGAGVIDVGAESTRPNATPLSHAEEWQRLQPVLSEIRKRYPRRDWKLSVDSYHAETVRQALMFGVDWINDVTGFTDGTMLDAVRDSEVTLVAMHSLGVPADPARVLSDDSPVLQILQQWAHTTLQRLESQGIARERIVLDPGIGFGKTPDQSLSLVRQSAQLIERCMSVTWLYGHSRKSYQRLLGAETTGEREFVTRAHSLLLSDSGVHYIRVHDVASHAALFRRLSEVQ